MRRVLTLGALALATLCLSGCCCGTGIGAHNAWLYEPDYRDGRAEPSSCQSVDSYINGWRTR